MEIDGYSVSQADRRWTTLLSDIIGITGGVAPIGCATGAKAGEEGINNMTFSHGSSTMPVILE